MKAQTLASTNTSGYIAPELYDLGNFDKVQAFWRGRRFDFFFWRRFFFFR
ncbi:MULTISPECIES: hypothetical protein [unclassified Moorena]|nr:MULTISPECIES: hypothetical protein [unclassified Moorena]NEO15086.1 hypothetical protein [Moorena sp. SIO3E8]NEQ01674.1 hypothetical protein [Moorena sp. SIO3F7]